MPHAAAAATGPCDLAGPNDGTVAPTVAVRRFVIGRDRDRAVAARAGQRGHPGIGELALHQRRLLDSEHVVHACQPAWQLRELLDV